MEGISEVLKKENIDELKKNTIAMVGRVLFFNFGKGAEMNIPLLF